MKKVLLLITILLLLHTTLSQSQVSIGISAGYDRNTLSTQTTHHSFTRYYSQPGLTISLPVRYELSDWFSVQAELTYLQKNNEMRRSYNYEQLYDHARNSYLQVPLLGHFSFGGDKLRGFLNVGGFGGYWMHGKSKGTMYNIFEDPNDDARAYHYNEGYVFDKRRDRRFEFGLAAGLGLDYHFSEGYTLFAEGRYYHSLTDMQKNYMINRMTRYNSTFALTIGCLINIEKIIHTNK